MWQRVVLGVLGLVFVVTGSIMMLQDGDSNAQFATAGASCLRIGALLLVIWLALPDIVRPRNWWGLGAVLLIVVVIVRAPVVLPYLIGALVLLRVLRPFMNASPQRSGGRRS